MGATHSRKKKEFVKEGRKKKSGVGNGSLNNAEEYKTGGDNKEQKVSVQINYPKNNIFDYKLKSIKMKYQNEVENRKVNTKGSIKKFCEEEDYPSQFNPFDTLENYPQSLDPFASEEEYQSVNNPFESDNIDDALGSNRRNQGNENSSIVNILQMSDEEDNNSRYPVDEFNETRNNLIDSDAICNEIESCERFESSQINPIADDEKSDTSLTIDDDKNKSKDSVGDKNTVHNSFKEESSENPYITIKNLKSLENSNVNQLPFVSLLKEYSDKSDSENKDIDYKDRLNRISDINNTGKEADEVTNVSQDVYLSSENKNITGQPEISLSQNKSQSLKINDYTFNCNISTHKKNAMEKNVNNETPSSAPNYASTPLNKIPPNSKANTIKSEASINSTFSSPGLQKIYLCNPVTTPPITSSMQSSDNQVFTGENNSKPPNSNTLVIHQEKTKKISSRYKKKYRAPNPPIMVSRTEDKESESLIPSSTTSSSKEIPDIQQSKEVIPMPSDSKSSISHQELFRKSTCYHGKKNRAPDPPNKYSTMKNAEFEIRHRIHRAAPPPPAAIPLNPNSVSPTSESTQPNNTLPTNDCKRKSFRRRISDLFRRKEKSKKDKENTEKLEKRKKSRILKSCD